VLIGAAVVLWSGYFFAWHEGYIPEKWRPAEVAVCTAATVINPGCWVVYAIHRYRDER
jgi:hypothetical protein